VATGGDRWEVRARDVNEVVRGAWVNRDIRFRITVAISLPLIFPFVIEFVARVIAVGVRGHHKCSRRPCRPPIFGQRITGSGWSGWWGWRRSLMSNLGCCIAAVGRSTFD
jgi:hypothetical protein